MNHIQHQKITKRIIYDDIKPESEDQVQKLYEKYEQKDFYLKEFEEIIDKLIIELNERDLYPTKYIITKIKDKRLLECLEEHRKNPNTKKIFFKEAQILARRIFTLKSRKIQDIDLENFFGFEKIDKNNLKKHSTKWEKASWFYMNDEWKFIGFEMMDKKTHDPEKLIFIKETGEGFCGGYLKSFNLNEIEIPKLTNIQQPWDEKTIKIYNNFRIRRDIKLILEEKVTGLNETHINIIKYIHSKGIPVFIVGGLVRDLVLCDSSNLKDIDIGFG